MTVVVCVAIMQMCATASFGQYIVVSPTEHIFSTAQGGALPVAQSFTISNSDGSSTLNWSLQDDAAWLDEDPTEGSGNYNEVALSINTTALPPDVYDATIVISSNAANGPQFVDVLYVVVSCDGGAEYGDANCDGVVNVSDAVYIINYVFKGGPPPGCP